MTKYRKLRIVLTKEQRSSLEKTIRKGTSGAMEIRRANVLLLADESGDRKRQKDVTIAEAGFVFCPFRRADSGAEAGLRAASSRSGSEGR